MATCGTLPNNRDDSRTALSRSLGCYTTSAGLFFGVLVDCLEGAPCNGRWNPYEIVLCPEENFSQGSLLGLPEL